MNKLIRATAVSAALLQAFAFSAHAEELHKDGVTSSGVRLKYETTTTPDGKLQIEFTLECRHNTSDPLYGVGAFAVINKAAAPANVQRNQLSCTAKAGLDKMPVSEKVTARMTMSGSPADIGTKVLVVGRVEKGKSPRTEKITKSAAEALDAELAKLTAS